MHGHGHGHGRFIKIPSVNKVAWVTVWLTSHDGAAWAWSLRTSYFIWNDRGIEALATFRDRPRRTSEWLQWAAWTSSMSWHWAANKRIPCRPRAIKVQWFIWLIMGILKIFGFNSRLRSHAHGSQQLLHKHCESKCRITWGSTSEMLSYWSWSTHEDFYMICMQEKSA